MVLRRLLPAVAVVGFLLMIPGASAHTTYQTEDDAYCITLGQHQEPVNTFQKTNLDLIIRVHLGDGDCDRSEAGEVGGVHETLTAALVAPTGEVHEDELVTQRIEVNRYQFANTYMLTQPGYYHVRLSGHINGSPVDDDYLMDHNIRDDTDLMFPDRDLPNQRDMAGLQQRVDALEAELAQIQAGGGGDANGAPGPGALLVVALVAFSALFLRTRSRK